MADLTVQATDKHFLRTIVQRDYALPANLDPYAFARVLLSNLGSPDSELRDELSYMIFANGIIAQQKLTPAQLIDVLRTALDASHLFYKIGESGTDSVFMRSFSNLAIAAILYSDAQQQALPLELVQQTRAALLRYAQEERDWRGYVKDKGWAHALAHLADALDECAQHRAMRVKERAEMLETVGKLARQSVPLYHEEDVRLAKVAYHIILLKQIDDDFLEGWLERCFVPREANVASWTRSTNAKNFLRSLYFLLHWQSVATVFAERISSVLQQQDAVYMDERY